MEEVKELALFRKYFGEYKIINNFKGGKMKVVKQLQIISIKPWQDTMKCSLKSSDDTWFSAFGKDVGKDLEGISQGDVVEIEYTVNERGFKNFTSVKLVEDSQLPDEEPPEEEREEKPPVKQRRGIDRVDKNCISAMQGALKLMEHLDLSKLKEEGIVEKFKALWEIIEEEISG